jgi:hypothetical protein
MRLIYIYMYVCVLLFIYIYYIYIGHIGYNLFVPGLFVRPGLDNGVLKLVGFHALTGSPTHHEPSCTLIVYMERHVIVRYGKLSRLPSLNEFTSDVSMRMDTGYHWNQSNPRNVPQRSS